MRRSTRYFSYAAATALLIPNLAVAASADETSGRVRIVVENNTFAVSDGAAWEGTLLDKWVDIGGMSAADLFDKTLKDSGFTQTGAKDNWITDINGLSAGADAAEMGGWMVGFDDWYGNSGITSLTLEDGDEIMLSYSLDWGADVGYDYMSVSTKLSSLTADSGELSPDFASDITEYTLTLPADSKSVKVTPTAENKGFRYKIYKNEYTPESDSADFKRTESIPVEDGDTLYIGVGNAAWHSYMPDGVTETVYKITVSGGSNDASDTDTTSDTTTDTAEDTDSSEEPVSSDTDTDRASLTVDSMISVLHSELTPADNAYAPGDEWVILTNARLGYVNDKEADAYAAKLNDALKNDPAKRATDHAKYTLVLTALGKDASSYLKALSDFELASKQGINGLVYTLLAFDSNNYDIPKAESGKEQTTREKLIAAILDAQLSDGGWAFFGETYEPDMTGMVLQALAPYYGKNSDVTKAVDSALKLLSEKQNSDGTYTSYGAPNCENSAQIIIALSALGIDADKDERFVKSGNSVLDGLKAFWAEDNTGFAHALNEERNALSSIQSYEALCAYKRFIGSKTAFYDMTDLTKETEAKNSDTDSSKNESSSSSSSKTSNTASSANTQTTTTTTGTDSAVSTGDSGYGAFMAVLMFSFAAAVVSLRKKRDKGTT